MGSSIRDARFVGVQLLLILILQLFCARNCVARFRIPPDAVRVTGGEAWCGAKCLWMIIHAYGSPITLDEVISALGTQDTGVFSLEEIEAAARELGFHALCVAGPFSQLSKRPEGTIVVIESGHADESGRPIIQHAQVLLTVNDDEVTLIDPLLPSKPIKITKGHFSTIWHGQAILISRDPIIISNAQPVFLVVTFSCFGLILIALVIFRGLSIAGLPKVSDSGALFLLLASVLATTGCSSGIADEGELVSFAESTDMVAIPTTSDLSITKTFHFENVSNGIVAVTGVDVGCRSCTKATYSHGKIRPGSSGIVSLTIDLKALPLQNRLVDSNAIVHLAGSRKVSIPLRLTVDTSNRPDVPRPHPQRLSFGRCYLNAPAAQSIYILSRKDSSIEAFAPESSGISITPLIHDSTDAYFELRQFEVTFVPRELRLPTDWSIRFVVTEQNGKKEILVPVDATVEHNLIIASPRRIAFGKIDDSENCQSVVLRCRPIGSGGVLPPLRIEDNPDVTVVQARDKDSKRETLIIKPRRRQTGTSAFFEGDIKVYCECDDVPPLLIPYFGYW